MTRVSSLEERVMICELGHAGYTHAQIAEQTSWSVPTVRKWRARERRLGRKGLTVRRGRHREGALSSFPTLIHETVLAWRRAHPGWGAKTLRAELMIDPRFGKRRVPDRSSIARLLKEQGLTRRYDRHRELPQPTTQGCHAPHDEWEMDARGYHSVADVGVVALINVNDRFSRVKLLSYPCCLGQRKGPLHPGTEDYQLVLRLCFVEWGLPDRLAVDHDSVFYDNTSGSPFPTRFHLWLLALGVSLIFGPVGRATNQAITERSHQTWARQVLEGQSFSCWQVLHDALLRRRDFMNLHLPCAPLGELPPLVAHAEALTPCRLYRPEQEAQLVDLARVHAYLSQGRWFRRVSRSGNTGLGGYSYNLGKACASQEAEITFDPTDRHLVFRSEDGSTTKRLPIRGITPLALMGRLGPLASLNQFQLALPLSWKDWQMIRLCETFSDTT